MILTLSWLKNHLNTNASIGKIIEKLTDIGLEVEGIKENSGELSEFKVLEFSKENRRIIVCLKDNIIDFEEEERKNKKKEKASESRAMKSVQSKINKATLGDLNILSDLKNKIDDE